MAENAPTPEELAQQLKRMRELQKKAKELTEGRGPGRPRLHPFVSEEDDLKRDRATKAQRSRERTRASQDIGELPPVKDPARKEACSQSCELFAKTYLGSAFYLPFADMHRVVIAKGETVVRTGGLFADALPRASGKTALARALALWSILYGYRDYCYYITANAKLAKRSLDVIKSWIWSSQELLDDFPEAIYPLRKLEREPRACLGQRYRGQPTLTQWSKEAIVFPTIPGSRSSGAVFNVDSITSGFRGADFAHPSGRSLRPSFVIPDDPQTDASARSGAACDVRERLIAGAILGLAPPDKAIGAIMPCTVIVPNDLSSRMLDVKQHPEWNGSRFGLVKSFPEDMKLWAEYREILFDFNPEIPDDNKRAERDAQEFYKTNHTAMSNGAELTWTARMSSDCYDALEFAMRLMFRDEEAFWAEYQNEPKKPKSAAGEVDLMEPWQIANKLSNIPEGQVPINTTRLTMGVDVQKNVLYYVVCAWDENFSGYIVAYGTFPEQGLPYFKAGDVQNTLARETRFEGEEPQIFAGLGALTGLVTTPDGRRIGLNLLGKEWDKGGMGQVATVERCIIDAGYKANIIYQFCRESPHKNILLPSHGRGIGAKHMPMHLWKRPTTDRRGQHWIITTAEQRASRYVLFDSNAWKTFVHARLRVPPASAGCLSLFGGDPKRHRMFSDHLTAERVVTVSADGKEVDEWDDRLAPDNHLFDALILATLAASVQGVKLPSGDPKPAVKAKRPLSFSEQYRLKHGPRRTG